MDYSEYLLRTTEDIESFQSRMGKTLEPAMNNIRKFVASLPNGAWIDYLKGVPFKNIPKIIGCICLYIQECDCTVENIDFNAFATMIRVRRYKWSKVSDLPSYDKYRAKMQNNGGPKQ